MTKIHDKPILMMLMALIILSPLGMDIFLPAIPNMAESLGTSIENIQLCIALYLFANGLGQIIAGPVADVYGRIFLARIGIFLYLIGALLSVYSETITMLWGSRILQGFGACSISVAVLSLTRDHYGATAATKAFSYLFGAIFIVPALAPLLGGVLLDIWGWRASFVFMAIYGLCALLLLPLILKETVTRDPNKRISFHWSTYTPVLTNKVFIFNSGLAMLSMAVIIHYMSYAPVKMIEQLGLTPNDFALWFGANALLNIVGFYLVPLVIHKIGKARSLQICALLCVGAGGSLVYFDTFNVLSNVNSALAFMLPVFISSLGLCLAFSICNGDALAPFGHSAGTAAAMLGLIQMSGASLLASLMQTLPIDGVLAFAITLGLPAIWYLLGNRLTQESVGEGAEVETSQTQV